MISVFFQEQQRYTYKELMGSLSCTEELLASILEKLNQYKIIKQVNTKNDQKNFSDFLDTRTFSVNIESVYIFVFVGVIIIENRVLMCYPKYLITNTSPTSELKQILKVLEIYESREQTLNIYDEYFENNTSNILTLMLFIIRDYLENGVYTNTQNITELNGRGDILWDKTINETLTIFSNNRPFYPNLITTKRVNNEFDFFKRLHECILTQCYKKLREAKLLDLFDIYCHEISNETIENFGETDLILKRLKQELDIQFNTRKKNLLNTLYNYIANSYTSAEVKEFSLFGTNSFNLVWEKVCSDVLDNQLHKNLEDLKLPIRLCERYNVLRKKKLIELIDKPSWSIINNNETFTFLPDDTLTPDIISIVNCNNKNLFFIFDAKYYDMQTKKNKILQGQPGIESITKQYLYQLSYSEFIKDHQFELVRNCFIMPTYLTEIIVKGSVSIGMLKKLNLQDIQVRLVPASIFYTHYIENTKIDIDLLKL